MQPGIRQATEHALLRDLHVQNRASTLLYPASWLFLVLVAELSELSLRFVLVNGIIVVVITGLRLAALYGWRGVESGRPHGWAPQLLSVSTLLNAAHLSAMTVWALYSPAVAVLRTPMVVAAFVGTTVALVALPPGDRRRAFALILALPPTLGMLLSGKLEWILTAGVATVSLAGVSVAALRQQSRFREAIATTELLRQRTLELERISSTDPMTGLNNRSHFDSHFELEWRRAYRQHYPVALLMIDLDHFKAINDQYGHLFGDRVLATVAESLRETHQRSGDLLARLGGEEFGLLLINTDFEGASQVAENICRAVAATHLDYQGQPIRITASVGVTATIPTSPYGTAAQALMHRADLALYEAKRAGRNRVAGFSDDTAASVARD